MKWHELVAIFIAGSCIGWLESSRSMEELNTILEIAFTIIAGTVVLGASVTFKDGADGNLLAKFVQAKKSVWPIALFLVGFTIVPPIVCLIYGCPE